MTAPESIALRVITEADSPELWRIRNLPDVRAVSRTPDEIARPDHDAWFARYIAKPTNHCFVVTVNDTVAGYCRVDDGLISIALDTAFHGRGLGTQLLTHAVDHGHAFFPVIRAEVQESNAGSLRLFDKCGFQRLGQEGGYVQFEHRGN